MSRSTLLHEVIDSRLLIAMFGEAAPSDAEWFHYLDAIAKLGGDVRVLAFACGAGPTLRQRRQLEAVLSDRLGRAAIVTTSRIAREVVAAIRWFDRDIRAFSPSEWPRVVEFMQFDADEARRVAMRMRTMAKAMDQAHLFELGEEL